MLTADEVRTIFEDCLFTEEEIQEAGDRVPEGAIIVQGIQHKFGFHPGRIEAHESRIVELLGEMHPEFYEEQGGGMTFLDACHTKHNVHWAEHLTMDQYFCLGMAVRRVRYCMPRDMWATLPGEMPYMVITKEKFEPDEPEPDRGRVEQTTNRLDAPIKEGDFVQVDFSRIKPGDLRCIGRLGNKLPWSPGDQQRHTGFFVVRELDGITAKCVRRGDEKMWSYIDVRWLTLAVRQTS